jgi:hypothetical protein
VLTTPFRCAARAETSSRIIWITERLASRGGSDRDRAGYGVYGRRKRSSFVQPVSPVAFTS